MKFDQLIERYKRRFKRHESFCVGSIDDLRTCIAQAGVPNLPGAYLIYGLQGRKRELLYVGKSGTVRTNGTFKTQGLARRLNMKQGRLMRAVYWAKQIEERRLDGLEFEWYVTFDGPAKVLPSKAESDLLQAYFDDYRQLPPCNAAI